MRYRAPNVTRSLSNDEVRLLRNRVAPVRLFHSVVVQHLLGTQPAGSQRNRRALMRLELLRLRPGQPDNRNLGQIVVQRQAVVLAVVLGSPVRHLNDQSARLPDQ